ncbi:MAG: Hydrolase [Microbacteriaceae bacterium]|nr:Hydrolase [Microbacteriaceae bacterium]
MTRRPHRASATGVARIVCEQISPVVGELTANLASIIAAVHRALDARADVIVLPELATSGYVFASLEEARTQALTGDDPFFTAVVDLLHGTDTVVVFGFCELAPRGVLYNSAALVTAEGVAAIYRKTHLWDRETLVFTRGDQPPPVITTVHGRIGIAICYDLEFSEMPRALALAGADLLAVPTNWPLGDHPAGERHAEIIIAQAAARTNGAFIAICDRAGLERGQAWNEGSVVIDQFGWVQAVASDAEHPSATADVFLNLARDKAISPHNNLLADRRPDVYSIEVSAK